MSSGHTVHDLFEYRDRSNFPYLLNKSIDTFESRSTQLRSSIAAIPGIRKLNEYIWRELWNKVEQEIPFGLSTPKAPSYKRIFNKYLCSYRYLYNSVFTGKFYMRWLLLERDGLHATAEHHWYLGPGG